MSASKTIEAVEKGSCVKTIRAFYQLTKPKILLMLVFTSLCAAIVAQRGIPNLKTTIAMLFGLALSSGGSAAINMWYDRDIDTIMQRTMNRPLPQGQVSPVASFWFGIILGLLSVLVLTLFVNPLTALLSFIGYFYYAVVYTMWLKRKTPHNIVIGGGAGAMPVLIGWASVTGHLSLAPILMFLVIFLWTPPHTWALALYKNSEYTKAGVPMMPVVKGPRTTKMQSTMYSLLLFICCIVLYFTGTVSIFYLIVAFVMNSVFTTFTILMAIEKDDKFVWAKRTFICSLIYILVLFSSMVVGI